MRFPFPALRFKQGPSAIGVAFLLALALPGVGGSLQAAGPLPDCAADHPDHPANPGALETVTGVVVKIDRMEKSHSVGRRGLHLTLRTADGQGVRVHLCPCAVLRLKGVEIHRKDLIRVQGYNVDVCGAREMIGVLLTKEGKTVSLEN